MVMKSRAPASAKTPGDEPVLVGVGLALAFDGGSTPLLGNTYARYARRTSQREQPSLVPTHAGRAGRSPGPLSRRARPAPARALGPVAAWLVGSRARGNAVPESDIDVIIVARTDRPFIDRCRDYLPAILAAGVGVDLLVYTPDEFERMRTEEQPFLSHAMKSAKPIHVG